MSDAGLRANKRQRGHRAVELHVAARLENLAMVRTLVGAIGTFEDLDFDAVADLRLAVDEVCTRLIRSATPDATLVVVVRSARRRGGRGGVDRLRHPRRGDARQLQLARPDAR